MERVSALRIDDIWCLPFRSSLLADCGPPKCPKLDYATDNKTKSAPGSLFGNPSSFRRTYKALTPLADFTLELEEKTNPGSPPKPKVYHPKRAVESS